MTTKLSTKYLSKINNSKILLEDCFIESHSTSGLTAYLELQSCQSDDCNHIINRLAGQSKPLIANETELSQVAVILEKLDRLDVKHIVITGCEPLESDRLLLGLARLIKSSDFGLTVQTSGMPIKVLEEFVTIAPIVEIELILDFSSRRSLETCNQNQGFPWEHRYLEILALLNRVKVPTRLKIGVSETPCNIQSLISSLHKDLIEVFDNVTAVDLVKLSDSLDRDSDNSVSDLLNTISKELLDHPQTSVKFRLVGFQSMRVPLTSATCGRYVIGVMPDGRVTPCPLLFRQHRGFLLGNLLRENTKIILKKLKEYDRGLRDNVLRIKSVNRLCRTCPVHDDCGGGCIASAIREGAGIQAKLVCNRIISAGNAKVNGAMSNLQQGDDHDKTQSVLSQKKDLTDKEERRIRAYVRRKLIHADFAHGFDHIRMVVENAKFIANQEGADLRLVKLAAYFHDIMPREPAMYSFHTQASANSTKGFLERLGVSEADIILVQTIIIEVAYESYLLGIYPSSLEAKVVRDADWLEAIGARGIARVFAFAADNRLPKIGDIPGDPEYPEREVMNRIGPDPEPVYHFFSKLLWLSDAMETNTGRLIAKPRHRLLVEFLKALDQEQSISKDRNRWHQLPLSGFLNNDYLRL